MRSQPKPRLRKYIRPASALALVLALNGSADSSSRFEANQRSFVTAEPMIGRCRLQTASSMTSRPRPLVTRQLFGRPGPPSPGGGFQEPPWLGTAFFAAIILSFIPGPWQIILSPIISLVNLFYMFKFGIFLLGIAALFGLQWWFDATTAEGQCPRCGTIQRQTKSEPFGCAMCGEALEFKDGQFIRYVKSGKVPGSPFEQMRDFAREATSKTQSKPFEQAQEQSAGVPISKPKPKVEIVDAEVL